MESEPDSILLQLLLIFILVLVNAFFAASEMAVISLNKTKINYMAGEGNNKAKLLVKLLEEPSKFLATIQVGITFAGFLASASAAVSISEQLSKLINKIGISYITAFSSQISLVLVTIALSFITLVLGELLPKRIALQNSESIAMFAVRPIVFISKITLPFVKVLTVSTNLFARIFNVHSERTEEEVTEEEIRMMIDVGEENGVLNETEKEMIDGIFEFDNTLAKEIMTHRTDVFAININSPIEQIIDEVLEEQYSRIPVYEDELDNIIGILFMKDLFIELRKKKIEDISIRNLLRPAYFVPKTKNTDILFRELQKSKNHMAILIDEYGGFSGIVTIEDLIEEVMGNIFDEYDEDYESSEYIQKLDNDTYIVNGMVSIDEINETLEINLPSEHFDTVGGFVIDLIGSIPKENEEHIVKYENLVFKVEKVNEKRIELLKICRQ
ncbi:hemolysin family protein [Clostridium sp. SYSU_GA19001]|uniref:hemolysin family protein n=1 Tax=Clostridium caldaquaticum TaxID=2940653 RepID=UPI002076E8ED|nr:hemolysin family protein [Clostridium caldaquaticum]MCM8711682.1 hemolysin family protein [Clostridium caldaquaticum]